MISCHNHMAYDCYMTDARGLAISIQFNSITKKKATRQDTCDIAQMGIHISIAHNSSHCTSSIFITSYPRIAKRYTFFTQLQRKRGKKNLMQPVHSWEQCCQCLLLNRPQKKH
uniref:Uncharacterized protein n=1 Tax=Anguilla anguilla TaxID=7936 RepID=A0A0E9XL37_ANGAN